MAITPQEAYAKAKPNAREMKSLEKKIDSLLVNAIRDDHTSITLSADLIPYNLFNFVKESYEKVGWSVKYESDQRDGDYIQFSSKKTKEYSR